MTHDNGGPDERITVDGDRVVFVLDGHRYNVTISGTGLHIYHADVRGVRPHDDRIIVGPVTSSAVSIGPLS